MSTATVRTVLFLLVFALNHATQASPEPASDAALAPLDGAVKKLWGVNIRAEKWKGDELFLAVDCAVESEEDRDRSATFSWNAKTDTLRLLGRR